MAKLLLSFVLLVLVVSCDPDSLKGDKGDKGDPAVKLPLDPNKPRDKNELRVIIFGKIKDNPKADLNSIDTGLITDMSGLFGSGAHLSRIFQEFNGDISGWNTSEVTNMSQMFYRSSFKGDISRWDVSKVLSMQNMFYSSSFSGDISAWNISNVLELSSMFYRASFNGDLSKWNTSNVRYMDSMFTDNEVFNKDISGWDVSNVLNMKHMFSGAVKFAIDLSKWNVQKADKDTSAGVFAGSAIENDKSKWPSAWQTR